MSGERQPAKLPICERVRPKATPDLQICHPRSSLFHLQTLHDEGQRLRLLEVVGVVHNGVGAERLPGFVAAR